MRAGAVCCAFLLALAVGNDPIRAEVPAADDTLQVHLPPGVQAPGINGCLTPPVPTYNVRVQSLMTSGGSVYTRQLVTTADIPCFVNSSTKTFLDATTIASCAEASAKNGLNSFSWDSGACKAYLAWRPQQRADCKDGGSKVVYVVKKPLTPFGGGEIIVSGQIRYDAPPQVFLDISHRFDFCGFSSKMHKSFKLLINGLDVVMLPEGSTTYNLDRKTLCSDSPGNISLWSVGADGKVNSNNVQVIIEDSSSNWYGLQTGGCVYNSFLFYSYVDSLEYCESMGNGTLYYEEVDGGAVAFLAALNVSGIPAAASSFYVGLTWNASSGWTWLGGAPQPIEDVVWVETPSSDGTWDCAQTTLYDGKLWLLPCETCNDIAPVVCYFSSP